MPPGLEATPNLHLRQGLVVDLIVENERVIGVEMQDTRRFPSRAVVIATGTFVNRHDPYRQADLFQPVGLVSLHP